MAVPLDVGMATTVVNQVLQSMASILAAGPRATDQSSTLPSLACQDDIAAMSRAAQCVLELEPVILQAIQQCLEEREAIDRQLKALP